MRTKNPILYYVQGNVGLAIGVLVLAIATMIISLYSSTFKLMAILGGIAWVILQAEVFLDFLVGLLVLPGMKLAMCVGAASGAFLVSVASSASLSWPVAAILGAVVGSVIRLVWLYFWASSATYFKIVDIRRDRISTGFRLIWINAAIRNHPRNSRWYYERASSDYLEESVDDLDLAIELNPDYHEALYLRSKRKADQINRSHFAAEREWEWAVEHPKYILPPAPEQLPRSSALDALHSIHDSSSPETKALLIATKAEFNEPCEICREHSVIGSMDVYDGQHLAHAQVCVQCIVSSDAFIAEHGYPPLWKRVGRHAFAPHDKPPKAVRHDRPNDLTTDDFAMVIGDLTKAIQIAPSLGEYHNELAKIWSVLGEYEKARNEYTRAIELGYTCYLSRAEIHMELSDYQAAISDFSKEIEQGERESVISGMYYVWRGEAFAASGDANQALADYSHVIKSRKFKGDPHGLREAYEQRAKLYESLGKPSLAADDRRHAAKIN